MASYKHAHTHITSATPEAVISFYRKAMGLKVVKETTLGSGEKAYDLDMGGIPVRISRTTGADEALKQEQLAKTGKENPPWGLHHIALEVDNMAEAAVELKTSGAEFLVEPKEVRPGFWLAFVRCPDGTLYELLQM